MASTYLRCPGSHGISKGDGKESTVCYGTFLLWTSTRTVHVRSCLVKGTQQSLRHLESGASWVGWWKTLSNSKVGDNRQDYCSIISYRFMQRFTNLLSIQFTQFFFFYSFTIYYIPWNHHCSWGINVHGVCGLPLRTNLRLFERNKVMNCLAL